MTYSLAVTGTPAENQFQPASLDVDDAVASSPGDEQQAQRLNTQFLARGPDGALFWATYDAERSVPGVRRVLLRAT